MFKELKPSSDIYIMDPSVGRFITMDEYQGSIFDSVSLHKYLYAHANPVMYTDPTGYFSIAELNASQTVRGVVSGISRGVTDALVFSIIEAFNRIQDGEEVTVRDALEIFAEELVWAFVPGFGKGKKIGQVNGLADNVAKKTAPKTKRNSKSTKNTTTLWDIKTRSDKNVKYNFHGEKVTAYRDQKTGLWWAKDTTGHGDSAFKVFKEAKGGKELHWVTESDKYGNYIINKHKSKTGTKIKIK